MAPLTPEAEPRSGIIIRVSGVRVPPPAWKAPAIYRYLSSDPVANGFELGHLAVLAAASLSLAVVAAVLFERRDVAS